MCVSVHVHGGARRGGTLFIVEKALLAKEDLPPLVLLNPFFFNSADSFNLCTQCAFRKMAVFQRPSRQEKKMCFG